MAILVKGIHPDDRKIFEEILRSSGYFYEFEIDIALGLADETLIAGGESNGYYWMKINDNQKTVAFANYARDSFSTHSWNLYWIAVHNESRNKKFGSLLIKAVEEDVKISGGRILWIETSGRPLYASTESFYRKNGYILQASLKDFYAPGDPKQIYSKEL
jgi:GNAT superfamily N-acetyltransferase